MSDYQIVRDFINEEERRRAGFYRYRPAERAAAMRRVADVKAALERMKKASEWNGLARYWQGKFD